MGSFKDKHGKTRLGSILSHITKEIPDLAGNVLDVVTSPNPLGTAMNVLKEKLGSKGDVGNKILSDINSLSDNDLKAFEASLLDTQNARDNETARDVSENTGWLTKNIHEVVAIIVVLSWLFIIGFSMHMYIAGKIGINDIGVILVASGIKDMVMLILGYLYGRTKPQS